MEEYISAAAKRTQLSGIRQISERAMRMKDVIRLELGEPDFKTPENIIEAAYEAMEKGYTHYTSVMGIPELREAIAEKLERENKIEADPEKEILVTCGGYHAIFVALSALLNPGDEVLVTDPCWSAYLSILTFLGAKVTYCPLDEEKGFEPSIEALERKISEKTKMIIINSPQNPTGAVWSRETIEAIVELAMKKDILILSDEVYEKLVFDGYEHFSPASIPDAKDRIISIFSFSKTYAMTGWRIGYVVANPTFIEYMKRVAFVTIACPNAFVQYAAVEALRGPQDEVNRMIREYQKRRDVIYSELSKIPGVKCVKPRGAFYIFPNFSEIMRDSTKLTYYLLEHARVAVVPGVAFGPVVGEGHIRISFATSTENLREAARRIREAIAEL